LNSFLSRRLGLRPAGDLLGTGGLFIAGGEAFVISLILDRSHKEGATLGFAAEAVDVVGDAQIVVIPAIVDRELLSVLCN